MPSKGSNKPKAVKAPKEPKEGAKKRRRSPNHLPFGKYVLQLREIPNTNVGFTFNSRCVFNDLVVQITRILAQKASTFTTKEKTLKAKHVRLAAASLFPPDIYQKSDILASKALTKLQDLMEAAAARNKNKKKKPIVE